MKTLLYGAFISLLMFIFIILSLFFLLLSVLDQGYLYGILSFIFAVSSYFFLIPFKNFVETIRGY